MNHHTRKNPNPEHISSENSLKLDYMKTYEVLLLEIH